MRKFILTTSMLGALMLPSMSIAETTITQTYIPNAQEVGSGRLTVFFWDVYDASLFAPDGEWSENKPYALSLSYLRDLKGSDIAERSVEEMREQGFSDEVTLATWHQKMKSLFPDVDDNTTLTGIRDQKGNTVFYHNGERLGAINDPEFSKWFFGIWLNENTSEPALRRKLLGMVS